MKAAMAPKALAASSIGKARPWLSAAPRTKVSRLTITRASSFGLRFFLRRLRVSGSRRGHRAQVG